MNAHQRRKARRAAIRGRHKAIKYTICGVPFETSSRNANEVAAELTDALNSSGVPVRAQCTGSTISLEYLPVCTAFTIQPTSRRRA